MRLCVYCFKCRATEERKYINIGGRYARVNEYLSVERLHGTIIKSEIEKSKNTV